MRRKARGHCLHCSAARRRRRPIEGFQAKIQFVFSPLHSAGHWWGATGSGLASSPNKGYKTAFPASDSALKWRITRRAAEALLVRQRHPFAVTRRARLCCAPVRSRDLITFLACAKNCRQLRQRKVEIPCLLARGPAPVATQSELLCTCSRRKLARRIRGDLTQMGARGARPGCESEAESERSSGRGTAKSPGVTELSRAPIGYLRAHAPSPSTPAPAGARQRNKQAALQLNLCPVCSQPRMPSMKNDRPLAGWAAHFRCRCKDGSATKRPLRLLAGARKWSANEGPLAALSPVRPLLSPRESILTLCLDDKQLAMTSARSGCTLARARALQLAINSPPHSAARSLLVPNVSCKLPSSGRDYPEVQLSRPLACELEQTKPHCCPSAREPRRGFSTSRKSSLPQIDSNLAH